MLHLGENGNLVNEPVVNHGNLMDSVIIATLAQSLCDDKNPLVIHSRHALIQFFQSQIAKVVAAQAVHMLLQRADRFH